MGDQTASGRLMQGSLWLILGHLLIGAGAITAVSILPGLALVRLLDPAADRLRRWLLAPALGLLILYGVAGWMVIVLGIYDTRLLLILLAVLNIIATGVLWQREAVHLRWLTPWERLEQALDRQRDLREDELLVRLETDTEREVSTQRALQARRAPWLYPALGLATVLSLLPLTLFQVPQGIDWIGFTTLSHTLATSGDLALPPVSIGHWTYPPAFPAIAAMLETATGMPASDTVHLLGQWTLLCIVLGIAGAADRWGAAAETLLALGLSAALFSKAYDSGYPTVASQLGLVLGLLVLVRPADECRRYHDVAFTLGIVSVAAIHPTGALYLGTFLIAHVIVHRASRTGGNLHVVRIIVLSLVLLAVATATVLLIFAPRLLDQPVLAEYGWQGSIPLLIFHGPVMLGLAGWAMWRFRTSLEGMLLATWIVLQWLLSFVHLFDGLTVHPVFTLISYSLYSMALHGFHLPLAALVGLLLARAPRLTPRVKERTVSDATERELAESTEQRREADVIDHSEGAGEAGQEMDLRVDLRLGRPAPRWVLRSVMVVVLLQLFVAQAALILVAQHPELTAVTDGDRTLVEGLVLPEGAVLYNEAAPWGHLYAASPELARTSFPGLGLPDVEHRVQREATIALATDNVTTLRELGISHAITSPIGAVGWHLARSPWWVLLNDIDGSRLWGLRQTPVPEAGSTFSVPQASACRTDCEMRPHIWPTDGGSEPADWPDERPFISDGALLWSGVMPPQIEGRETAVRLVVDGPAGLEVHLTLQMESRTVERAWRTDGGWQQFELRLLDPQGETFAVHLEVNGGGQPWVNPLGVSGRDTRIIDSSGLRIHWLELRPM